MRVSRGHVLRSSAGSIPTPRNREKILFSNFLAKESVQCREFWKSDTVSIVIICRSNWGFRIVSL